ncbi:MAG: hypothetical protein K2W96_19140, partial [Gemmataceae bacterium]|nr:hypothetical protein [Gemmataceae bacterium]
GGLHATACPDDAAPHFDSVVVGEGEPVWPDVLRDAEAGALAKPGSSGQAPACTGLVPHPGSAQYRPTKQRRGSCPSACGAASLAGSRSALGFVERYCG